MNAIAPITVRPIARPNYAAAETYEAWIKLNAKLVHDRWCALQVANGLDPDQCEYADLLAFAKCQFDISSPASADTANKSLSHGQKDVPTASLGSVEAGIPYPVTCRARYYDAASRILEEEGQLLTHDNADELGHVIQKWIEKARDNWEPRS